MAKRSRTIPEKVVAYLKRHPNSSGPEIKKGIGVKTPCSAWHRLWQAGILRRKIARGQIVYRIAR